VNGQRETANGFMVNGSNVVDGKNNGAAIIPNLDSSFASSPITSTPSRGITAADKSTLSRSQVPTDFMAAVLNFFGILRWTPPSIFLIPFPFTAKTSSGAHSVDRLRRIRLSSSSTIRVRARLKPPR